jgi:hypothetical protein
MRKLVSHALRIPYGIFNFLAYRGFFKWIPDELFLKMRYRATMGKKLDLNTPRTFNEKLQWLKIHDRNPLYTTLADKYAVREYIRKKLGEEYLIPLVGGPWQNANEIDFDRLPNQFVLKCTHDSGGIVICRDKDELDIKSAKKMLNRKLRKNYFYWGREWPYKNIKPQIIAEKYVGNNTDRIQHQPVDYKIFCFDGEPKIIMTVTGGHDNERNIIRRFYDVEWNKQKIGVHGKNNYSEAESQPAQLSQLLDISKKLSTGIKHVRLDFYIINETIKFGEFTFYHMSGFEKFSPEKWNLKLGKWINIKK